MEMHPPDGDLYDLLKTVAPCAGFNTRRVSRLASQYYDHALAPLGLKSTQYSLLGVLGFLGPAPLHQVAEILAMDRTTLTRNLGPLERQGWIQTSAHQDKRIRLLSLSAAGQAAYEKAQGLWQAAQDALIQALGPGTWDSLLAGLHQLSRTLEPLLKNQDFSAPHHQNQEAHDD